MSSFFFAYENHQKLFSCFYFHHALGHSVDIRWPEKDDGLTVKLKVKQASSADWFGIGFSVGNMMVMLMLCISMRTHRHKNIIQILHNPVILSFFQSDGIDAVIARVSDTSNHTIMGQHWYW